MYQKTSSKTSSLSKEKILQNEEAQLKQVEDTRNELLSAKSSYEAYITSQQESMTKLERKLEILNHVDKSSETLQKDLQNILQDGLIYTQTFEKKLDHYRSVSNSLQLTLKDKQEEHDKRLDVLSDCN